MYFQFLIEDKSSEALVETVMSKIENGRDDIQHNCKSFKGIGGFTRKNTVKETKTGKLLNDLATYLRGFDKSLPHTDAAVIVVLDNDTRDTAKFQTELEQVANQNMITIDHVFCIAVEEMEAWLLGDENAVLKAYPDARMQVIRSYVQDSICGTWEKLADAVYKGGLVKFKKDCPTYQEKGKYKSEWSWNIGKYMEFSANKSPSFQKFISEINKRIDVAS